jgi:hypothetical protein
VIPFVDYRNDPSNGGTYIAGDAGHDTYDVPFVEPEAVAAPFPDNGIQFVDIGGTSSPDGSSNGSATEPEQSYRPTLAGYSPSIDEALSFERAVTGAPAEDQIAPFADPLILTSDGSP